MKTKEKGNLAEAKVLFDLLSKGLHGAIPFGDNLPFDIIAITSNYRLLKIQVKHCTIRADSLIIRLENCTENTKIKFIKKYVKDEVDFFVAFDPMTEKVYYVPYEMTAGKRMFSIRLKESRQTEGVHWHEDFNDIRRFL